MKQLLEVNLVTHPGQKDEESNHSLSEVGNETDEKE